MGISAIFDSRKVIPLGVSRGSFCRGEKGRRRNDERFTEVYGSTPRNAF